jgi:hypothetical protein
MSTVKATPEQLKAAGTLIEQMQKDGGLKVKEPPVWAATVPLVEVLRTNCEVLNDGGTIVPKEGSMPKELKKLEGAFIKCKGKGPVVIIADAKAMREYNYDFTNDRGAHITGTIPKGKREIRAFAI